LHPFFVTVLIVVLLQRLLELRLAKKNSRYLLARGGYEVGANHYAYIVLLHGLFFLSLTVEVLVTNRPIPSWWWLPFTFFLLAQAGRYWCIKSLGRFWNTRIYVLPGTSLVKRGPYRYLRHPNYLVVALELLTLPLTFAAYATALVFLFLNAAMLLFIRIPAEERALEQLNEARLNADSPDLDTPARE
jgi:methyltransferase